MAATWEDAVRAWLESERRQAARRLNDLSDLLDLPRYQQVRDDDRRRDRRGDDRPRER